MYSNPNRIAFALCLGFVALAILYAAAIPPFESPDEASHFLYAHNLQQTGQLPILEDHDTVFASQSAQRHHPPLYYLIGALLISPTQRADLDAYLQPNPLAWIGVVADNNQNVYLHPVPAPNGDTALAIWIFRLYSIALGTLTVWLIYRCAMLIAGDPHVALIAALLVISLPTFISISASINSDNLVTLLHAAGVYLCLKIWHCRWISRWDIVLISLLLAAVALTKINGLSLFGIVYGWLLLGVFTRRLKWREVAALIGISLVVSALLAGWWYVRNLQLYGDSLALDATLRIWGRGGAPHVVSLFEAKGIWESFWFTLGYFNVRGPDWLYDLYLPTVTILAFLGAVVTFWRERAQRLHLLFLLSIVLLAVLSLLVATSRIDVSQGRILFPGMVAFAPLMAVGWTKLLGRKLGGLIVAPLTVLALITPFTYLPSAYPSAAIVSTLPASAQPVNVSAGGITVLGYERLTDVVQADRWVRFNLYLRGSHPDNPFLFVKALYPLNGDVLGGVDTYPGMLPTQSMIDDRLYVVPMRFRLDEAKLAQYPAPYLLQLVFGWSTPDGTLLPMQGENGAPLDAPMLPGPTVLNTAPAFAPQRAADILYGGTIRLIGYTLSAETLSPGESLSVTLNWEYAAPIHEDWTVTVGLLDAAGQPLVAVDGGVPGYPTSAWRTSPSFADSRTLTIPPSAAPGDYTLYVGWYRPSDLLRLAASGDNIQNDLFMFPHPLTICAPDGCPGAG
ncbi:MAG: phospholipid carrier-dependent glycosyltransferase [Chloroflexota bacterium]